MKKVALLFVLAVFVPSLVLAWLAMRSLRDQQFALERQQSLLYQGVADGIAGKIGALLADRQRQFSSQVDSFLAGQHPRDVAMRFDEQLRAVWPLAEVGFAVTYSGRILSPSCPSPPSPGVRTFCLDNVAFLGNREIAEVYWNTPSKGGSPVQVSNTSNAVPSAAPGQQEVSKPPEASEKSQLASKTQPRKVNPTQPLSMQSPHEAAKEDPIVSKLTPAEAEFRQLIGDDRDGMFARFLQNKLKVMFWHRPELDSNVIFGAQLDLGRLTASLRQLIQIEPLLREDICVALLDDNAKPVVLSHPQFQANWKRPFVATEIGDALPHWEVAAYLLHPDRLKQSAQTFQLTLGLLILVLVLAIGSGSWLIVHSLNEELRLARQKTDFVSNVSHELKTPLTSIRMFSELLAEGRVEDPAKRRSYFNIILSEAARLTRLINNVLDFSRLERGDKKYNFSECDLAKIAHDTAETYRPHLENNHIKLACSWPSVPLPVRGDGDALAQIIVNLLSNAEKYSNGQKEIALQVERSNGALPCAEVKILDRGSGVPRGSEEKIFEQFYRAHDSLSSGIQGSGLGLTLARQIARAHDGDVVYQPREGGGSCFCLRLPLLQN
jgi:signal transduction histidine kinase